MVETFVITSYSIHYTKLYEFLWDWGLYAMTNEFVAKLFLVIILISGAWCYYELKHSAVEPPNIDGDIEKTIMRKSRKGRGLPKSKKDWYDQL